MNVFINITVTLKKTQNSKKYKFSIKVLQYVFKYSESDFGPVWRYFFYFLEDHFLMAIMKQNKVITLNILTILCKLSNFFMSTLGIWLSHGQSEQYKIRKRSLFI